MRYCNCTKEQVCELLIETSITESAKERIRRSLSDAPLRLFADGEIRSKETGYVLEKIPGFSEEELGFFCWEGTGADILDSGAVEIVYTWVYGALGDFHGALLKAFSTAEEDNYARLCEGFPDIGMAFSLWRKRGDDWLYEEHHGAPR